MSEQSQAGCCCHCGSKPADGLGICGSCRTLPARVVAEVEAAGREAARVFSGEFPGQSLSGDWDGQAWEIDQGELSREAEVARGQDYWGDGSDPLWPIYAEALRVAVETANAAPVTAAEHEGPAPTCDYWHPYGDARGFCGVPAVVEYRERLHPAGVLYRCARHDGPMYTLLPSAQPERFIRAVIPLQEAT